jgi:subtilisin family serine protease
VDVQAAAPLAGDSALTVRVASDEAAEAAAVLRSDPAVAFVEVDHVARMAAVPNDPVYPRQWGLSVAKVDRGWGTTHGARRVTIAVVDTGVTAVPDLAGRLLPGKDFVNDDEDPADDQGHGTMVAGVLGASANNRTGVAGVCWHCRILPVKVLGAKGYGSYSDIAQGIRYAADRRADIINLSLGGPDDSQLLRSAVDYAVSKGSLVVAAAGNDGRTRKHYPAALPKALAVGASTQGDARYSWSNHGADWVDIAAPGCNPAPTRRNAVGNFCGTSSATPLVAGVAALLKATNPAPTAAQIRTALTSSAAPVQGTWVARGSGRVDAAAALKALPFFFTGVSSSASVGSSFTLRAHVGARSGIDSVSVQLNGVTVARDTAAPWTLTVRTARLRGVARLTVVARDGAVLRSRVEVPVTVTR